jgi:translation elongation factor P/translation initiation factor 5A
MKISAVEVKPGMIIEHKNDYWNVLKAQHVKPGKGGAFNQVELKSLIGADLSYWNQNNYNFLVPIYKCNIIKKSS